jgi:multidrug resistance efflux pump
MTDPDEIMAEHHRIYEMYCDACQPATHWPCLPYRLAAENAALRADVQRLREQNKASSDEWTKRTAAMESELARRRQDVRRGVRLLNEAVGRGDQIGWSDNDLHQMVAYLDRLADVRGEPWPEHVTLDQFRAALALPEGEQ